MYLCKAKRPSTAKYASLSCRDPAEARSSCYIALNLPYAVRTLKVRRFYVNCDLKYGRDGDDRVPAYLFPVVGSFPNSVDYRLSCLFDYR